MAKLIVLAGLPGSGKSSIARGLASEIGAVWLRIDSIEQAIKQSGIAGDGVNEAGYVTAYAVAKDNLRLGHDVIGDSVNGLILTRDAWRNTGLQVGAKVIEIEIQCTDQEEHRHRVENRQSDVPGLKLPSWEQIVKLEYDTWDRERLTIDTAGRSIADCVEIILATL